MVAQRSRKPDRLRSEQPVVYRNGNQMVFQYSSLNPDGQRNDNIIVLTLNPGGKIVGFREYISRIDPKWLK